MASCPPLAPEALYHRCNPDSSPSKTPLNSKTSATCWAKYRAVEAIRFSVAVEHDGYNLFVLSPPGVGRHSFIQQFLSQKAIDKPTPSDWCYVNNFEQPRQPKAIELPAGKAGPFRADIHQLIEEAHSAIPAALGSEKYRDRRQAIEQVVTQQQQEAFETIRRHAIERELDIIETATGFLLVLTDFVENLKTLSVAIHGTGN